MEDQQNPFDPFPVLTTARLVLRRLELEDKEQLFALRSDPEVNKYLHRDAPVDHDAVTAHIEKVNNGIRDNKWFYWVVSMKGKPELIGTICLWNFSEDRKTAELGYEMRPEFQNRGIMTEALAALLEYGFDTLELDFMEAFTHEHNEPSIHLLRKFGFVLVPERRDAEVPENRVFVLSALHYNG